MVLADGEVHDSLRGWRGSYLPIPDMPVDKVTAFEAAEYRRFADYYRAQWGRMDPVLVGMMRKALPENREQVTVDVMMTPFAPQHFDLLRKYAGPPDDKRLAPDPRRFGGVRCGA